MYINRLRYLRPLVLWIHHWPTHPPLSGMHPTAPINKRRNATWPWPTNWDAKWLFSSPLVGNFNHLEK